MSSPVKKVKPLGFVWETSDPFLFCVHHEDQFPKGNESMGPAVSLEGRNIGDDFIIKVKSYNGTHISIDYVKTIDSFAKQVIDPDNTTDVSLLSYRFAKYLETEKKTI